MLVSALVAGLASSAAAHQDSGQSGRMIGPGAGQGAMMGPGMMGCPGLTSRQPGMGRGQMMPMDPMMGDPTQHIEGRIAFLKTELGITQEQEEVWNAYADSLREAAQSMQGMHEQMMSGDMPATLPERMRLHTQMMSAQIDALKTVQEAIVPLYDALSPEQKKTADNLMGMM